MLLAAAQTVNTAAEVWGIPDRNVTETDLTKAGTPARDDVRRRRYNGREFR